MNWFQFSRFFKYLFSAGHYKGFGIHSPFAFHLVRELIYDKHPYYAFDRIRAMRNTLLKMNQKVSCETFGAPGKVGRQDEQSVRQIVKQGSLPPKYGQLLFRLISRFGFTQILELGTGVGAGTLYLALPDSRAAVYTLEGNRAKADLARRLFVSYGLDHVQVVTGRFSDQLPDVLKKTGSLDFVFFDGDHRRKPTLEYFNRCLTRAHNNSLFVFDDIHWSPGMEQAWSEIISHPRVTVSIDLFRIGLVFFRKESPRQHFKVWF